MKRSVRCGIVALTALAGPWAMACAPNRPTLPLARTAPSGHSAAEILPADLDVVLWLDVARLRGLWSVKPDRQIVRVLAEYGLFAATSDAEAAFWLALLEQSSRWWIGCRPTRDGCRDIVVFARGRFDRHDPLSVLPDTSLPLDLGAGWFRYSRKVRVGRQQPARIYVAPPDRIVVVSPAEVDAVERTLERGQNDPTSQAVEERGLFSMALRPVAMARIIEYRAPAAARLLREARVVRLWLDADAQALRLSVSVGFSDHERAELAREAFSILWKVWNASDARSPDVEQPLAVVGNDLVLHLRIAAPAEASESRGQQPHPESPAEPAAQ